MYRLQSTSKSINKNLIQSPNLFDHYTDNGHEFQTKFQWHISDLGMLHVYIKPTTPRLNGKVERSHLTDQREFYQMLDDDGDVNLREKLAQWESYYNFLRPHSAHAGKTPYAMLKLHMLG